MSWSLLHSVSPIADTIGTVNETADKHSFRCANFLCNLPVTNQNLLHQQQSVRRAGIYLCVFKAQYCAKTHRMFFCLSCSSVSASPTITQNLYRAIKNGLGKSEARKSWWLKGSDAPMRWFSSAHPYRGIAQNRHLLTFTDFTFMHQWGQLTSWLQVWIERYDLKRGNLDQENTRISLWYPFYFTKQ